MELFQEIISKEHVLEQLKKVQLDLKKLQYLEKELVSFEEGKKYLSLSESDLITMINDKKIPFYSTEGQNIYFRKSELEYLVFSGKFSTTEGFDKEVEAYLCAITII
ncbi:helix-turn-helix domain-containing protein [Flavobacterium urumqiense]|uniref:Helix-turn-helix domain-containing protein n=1 Tax=Flavobacterium urumqiense TaxID=935224 RepID=A0A1H5TDP3_9FLAO|nr:helix-turn-helix domain-containing protein [Flavobacterium urumqiense]SEF60890.1 hypothetical protein SAMN04488130_101664 [Flavobacterium urumqiense]